jgi:hypothetical protein
MPQRPDASPSTMIVPPCAVAPVESLALPRTWIRPDELVHAAAIIADVAINLDRHVRIDARGNGMHAAGTEHAKQIRIAACTDRMQRLVQLAHRTRREIKRAGMARVFLHGLRLDVHAARFQK